MTDSNANELLHRLLDESGVEYEVDERNAITKWSTHYGAFVFFARQREGKLLVETTVATEHSLICTPEQAVAATLGRGECENASRITHHFQCSSCGDLWKKPSVDEFKFCPTCGAKIRKAVER